MAFLRADAHAFAMTEIWRSVTTSASVLTSATNATSTSRTVVLAPLLPPPMALRSAWTLVQKLESRYQHTDLQPTRAPPKAMVADTVSTMAPYARTPLLNTKSGRMATVVVAVAAMLEQSWRSRGAIIMSASAQPPPLAVTTPEVLARRHSSVTSTNESSRWFADHASKARCMAARIVAQSMRLQVLTSS